ncbi:MAG TPA: alkaline phosphatase D family protein, partial [Pseudomonadales bacterium]|nr:alkaline phosphatase D family protein [Pseudomonadales bacterium]
MKVFSDRRHFIKTVIATSVAIGTGGLTACSEGHAKFAAPVDRNAFPQSVMSGDPTPNSVILWTRYPSTKEQERLRLEVATDANFDNIVAIENVSVFRENDYCVKVRVINLKPATYYYYRFMSVQGMHAIGSPTGRTKTAPANDQDIPVKFAFVSCQDYIGRYYNTYFKILEQDDLDFVVHLGDYIYETTGDASFQVISAERGITFDDLAGAVHVKTANSDYYGAASLDNYRQLYRTYRTDPALQAVQERFPLVATWDDHEFSDDSWQINATYYNGRKSEAELQRKRNSEQAWMEYLPIDHEAAFKGENINDQEVILVDDSYLYPNTKIYRDFQFGQHLHLMLTDYRTYRPDHIIPEDAYPGTIVIDEAALTSYYASLSDSISNHTSLFT